MRIAALAFGILAGLVASLILALGGLDVPPELAGSGDRQEQAIRFGLLVIANLGVFGAALVLSAPLASAIILLAGGLAWVGAALLTHHSTDYVLITPPALLLLAAVFAGIAHFRRPAAPDDDEESEIEIIAPREERGRASEMMEEDEIAMPAFAGAADPAPSPFEDDGLPPQGDKWNPRRRPEPPPRARADFRPIEEEYDDEPSGFSRFAMGLSSVLSFGLYAALAVAAFLLMWNLRGTANTPATVVADLPSSSAPALPSSTEPSSSTPPPPSSLLSSEPQALQAPVLTADNGRQLDRLTPSATPVTPPTPERTPQRSFEPGTQTSSLPPAGVIDEPAAPATDALPPVEEPGESPPPEPSAASVPDAGAPFPSPVPPQMAALRTTPAPPPVSVATPVLRVDNTGL